MLAVTILLALVAAALETWINKGMKGFPGNAPIEARVAAAAVSAPSLPALRMTARDVDGPIKVDVVVVSEGGLGKQTHLRVTARSMVDLSELRILPAPPSGFERPKPADAWIFKPVTGKEETHDFYLRMTNVTRHFVKVYWAGRLASGELWTGDTGVTLNRGFRMDSALGVRKTKPSGDKVVQVRAIKRQGGGK